MNTNDLFIIFLLAENILLNIENSQANSNLFIFYKS